MTKQRVARWNDLEELSKLTSHEVALMLGNRSVLRAVEEEAVARFIREFKTK